MKQYFISTPLYYVNDVPHIGHAYTTIAADVLARWRRLNGDAVYFLTGTDEHGQKIAEAANKNNEKIQDYVDRIASEFKRLWSVLNISFDDFIQTTEPRHQAVVQAVFEKLKSNGNIVKGTYEDWYCVHDESYFSESELVDKKCPSCGRDVEKLKEESYFFRLSNYQKPLLDYYDKNPHFLSPRHRANEILNFVRSGLRDLSVSRTRVKWGVPIKSDPGHVAYVWFDALLNYISAPGYDPANPSRSPFADRWPADVHLVGKEIYRFHTVIWPAMLMALDLPLPKKVFAHGWWTVEGRKMSKSLGNVVDPHTMAAEYGVDAFRYFLLREVPFGSDGDFSEKSLQNRANAELSNNLGNLLQRTSTLTLKHFGGKIPARPATSLLSDLNALMSRVENAYASLSFTSVLDHAAVLMVKTNKYIDDQKPWTLSTGDNDKLETILKECLSVLKALALLLWPYMPQKMEELWNRLGETTPLLAQGPVLLEGLRSGQAIPFGAGQTVQKGEPLFPRLGGRWK